MRILILILTLAFSGSFWPSVAGASALVDDPNGRIEIPYLEIKIGAGPLMWRSVKYQVPNGTPPRNGWPVVLLFQGTIYPVEFSRSPGEKFGLYYEAVLIKSLLQNGFAVLAPPAIFNIGWVTNIARVGYEFTSDYFFTKNILDGIARGAFGPLDSNRIFAAGISSGGYNTSRMAVSFPGKFRALAIHSGSYATCLSRICNVPKVLPQDHPPTLFLYGERDRLVPRWTVEDYYNGLVRAKIPVHANIDATCGHEWCRNSPGMIVKWFKWYNQRLALGAREPNR